MTKARSRAVAPAAKGDLQVGNGSLTSGILPVGADGSTLVADSSQTTGLGWAGNVAAGKNAVINGGFDIWQRGTSFSANYAYTADRWQAGRGGGTLNITVSRQATNDTTNLPNIQYCARVQRDSGVTTTNTNYFGQNFETVNSIPFTGKTATVSFYARAGANFSSSGGTMTATLANGTGTDQNYLIGQYTNANTIVSLGATLTTTWQRFTMTGTVPTNSTELAIQFSNTPVGTAGANDYFEITGVQLELGSSATPFSRAGGSIGGELALCQRYYVRFGGDDIYQHFGIGTFVSTTAGVVDVPLPIPMRVAPTSIDFSTCALTDNISATVAVTGITMNRNSKTFVSVNATGSSGWTAYRPCNLTANNSTSAYIGFNAEL